MATSKLLMGTLLLLSGIASARESATPAACQAAALRPPIADAKNAVAQNPKNARAQARLADAWSDAGCFNDAVQVLVSAQQANPDNAEIATRLRVARSVVGEEHFFDNLDREEDQARLKRATFRCTSLSDADACAEALRARPDDGTLWTAQGDAFMHAHRPREALDAYRHAATLKPDQADLARKITTAQNQAPSPPPPADSVDSGAPPIDAAVRLARVPATRHSGVPRSQAEAPPIAGNSNVEPESHSR